MARQWIRGVVGVGACLALAGSAMAQQTGTLTITDGTFQIGTQLATIDPTNPPVLVYSYDGAGTLALPADQAYFPPVIVGAPPPVNEIDINISLTEDGSGSIDPVGGLATASLSLFFALSDPGHFLPDGCGIGPVALNPTTDVSGQLTGTPYDSTSGTAGFVENVYEVPQSSGCSIFGPAIDSALGLPSPSGNNQATLNVLFEPAI